MRGQGYVRERHIALVGVAVEGFGHRRIPEVSRDRVQNLHILLSRRLGLRFKLPFFNLNRVHINSSGKGVGALKEGKPRSGRGEKA